MTSCSSAALPLRTFSASLSRLPASLTSSRKAVHRARPVRRRCVLLDEGDVSGIPEGHLVEAEDVQVRHRRGVISHRLRRGRELPRPDRRDQRVRRHAGGDSRGRHGVRVVLPELAPDKARRIGDVLARLFERIGDDAGVDRPGPFRQRERHPALEHADALGRRVRRGALTQGQVHGDEAVPDGGRWLDHSAPAEPVHRASHLMSSGRSDAMVKSCAESRGGQPATDREHKSRNGKEGVNCEDLHRVKEHGQPSFLKPLPDGPPRPGRPGRLILMTEPPLHWPVAVRVRVLRMRDRPNRGRV